MLESQLGIVRIHVRYQISGEVQDIQQMSIDLKGKLTLYARRSTRK